MTYDSFDITFCNGEVHYLENGEEIIKVCPVKGKCHRFWTKEHSQEAKRLGLRYHSFFLLTDPNSVNEKGCGSFWEEKDEN